MRKSSERKGKSRLLTRRNVLHVDASARQNRSLTRKMGRRFTVEWLARNPDDIINYRDVGSNPPPFVSEKWIAAAFTPRAKRTPDQVSILRPSEILIDELRNANILVIATPMYNYGMPAALKAWVDQVIRVNETFSFDLGRGDYPLEPLLSGKKMVLLTSSGEFGFAPGGVRAKMNHLDTHLRTLGGYLGASEIHHIAVEFQEFGDKRHENSLQWALGEIPELVKRLGEGVQSQAA